jgi:hypothetical protein
MRKFLASRFLAPVVLLVLAPRAFAADEIAVATSPAPDPGGGDSGAINGLFPLWEQTALLHPAGTAEVGYGHAQIGLGRLQLGTQPILDAHQAFNLDAKVALWRGPRLSVALLVGATRFPTAAERNTVGNLNPTGFTDPYAPVWLVPITLAKSLRIGTRFALHWASTLLVSQSSDPALRYLSGGQAFMFEAAASPQWSARLHLGAEGWPVQTSAHAGVSVAYTGKHVFGSVGVGRRLDLEDGEGANTVMFDGGLLFR